MDASSFMLFILFFSSLGGVISAFLINEKLRVFLIVLLIIVVGVMIFFEIFFLNKISPRKHPVLVIDSDKNKYIILGKTIDGYVLVGTFQTGDGESDSSELEQKFISTEEIMNYTFKELKQQDDETSAPNNNDQNK